MSTVYAAFDPHIERHVAIKVLPHALLHDLTFRARFKREAKMVASLNHPYIVPVYDFGEEDGQPYLVMQLMAGGSLSERLTLETLPSDEIEQIVQRITGALTAAHEQEIIHRDLKPGNVLFDEQGLAYLSDFGIARLASNTQMSLTNTGGAIGTPGYMSPEQIQGRPVDGRSDIYGLGVLLFEMLTGQKPFDADTPAMVIVKQMTETVPNICDLNPTLNSSYDDLIRHLTATARRDRPATATDVFALLQAINQNGTVEIKPIEPLPTSEQPPTAVANPEPPSTIFQALQAAMPAADTPIKPPLLPDEAVLVDCPNCRASIVVMGDEEVAICTQCQTAVHLTSHLCPYCDTYHPNEQYFCDHCGAAMVQSCWQCHAPNWPGHDRCTTCGSRLDIFENLRQHDSDTAAQNREARRNAVRQLNEEERESSHRRLTRLWGNDPDATTSSSLRRPLALAAIFVIVALLAVIVAFIVLT